MKEVSLDDFKRWMLEGNFDENYKIELEQLDNMAERVKTELNNQSVYEWNGISPSVDKQWSVTLRNKGYVEMVQDSFEFATTENTTTGK